MFASEADFEDVPEIKMTSKFSRPNTAISQRDDDLEDEDDVGFRSAGALNSANSRARMLAQQREIALKKRQSSISSGMVRSSIDSNASASPVRASGDGQFTPAIRQFSAPKAVLKGDQDEGPLSRDKPMVSVPKSASSRRPKYSDDEEDDRRGSSRGQSSRGSNQQSSRNNRREDDDERIGSANGRRGVRSLRLDDDEEDRGYNSNSNGRNNYSSNGNSGMYRDPDSARKGGRDRERDRRAEYEDPDEYTYSGGRGGGSAVKSRDGRKNGSYDDRDDRDGRGGDRWGGKNATGGSMDRERERRDDHRYGTERDDPPHGPSDRDNNSKAAPIASPVPAPVLQVAPDLSNMRRFLSSPVPRACGIIQCYIRRNKSGTNKLFPIYSLYLKEGDVFLLASKKRPKNKTSNYLISMDQNDLNRSGANYLGKLRSNFVGTEFQVFDDGINPKDGTEDEGNTNSNVRCEMAGVMYAANVLGARGPRKMQVAMPGVDENGEILRWRDSMGPTGTGTNDDMLSRIKDRNFRDMIYLINKPPRWNEQVGAYVLNFNGRVTMASVKNFQLVDPEEQNAVVLQFGRVGKDDFTMDLQWPMSPFQAFAITLSSFDSKIACD